ncbi:CLUMA_CG008186, isoform A [Clunio marinus]|uniref:CLUMA_CG008186, isoform A n=1 Tax=Clunio marinus TaxID=568069 RepID=A0A1J1I6W1_9DIPT|nr:CLUMA_CG008186, isoform A [Clunio marinus]
MQKLQKKDFLGFSIFEVLTIALDRFFMPRYCEKTDEPTQVASQLTNQNNGFVQTQPGVFPLLTPIINNCGKGKKKKSVKFLTYVERYNLPIAFSKYLDYIKAFLTSYEIL